MESFVLEIFFLKNLNVYNSFQLRNTAGNRVVCLNCFGKLAGPILFPSRIRTELIFSDDLAKNVKKPIYKDQCIVEHIKGPLKSLLIRD